MADHIPRVEDPFDPDLYLTREKRSEIAAGFRAFADWLEATEFPISKTSLYGDLGMMDYASWHEGLGDSDVLAKRPRAAVRLIGGRVEKEPSTYYFQMKRDFGGGVAFRWRVDRSTVCTPVEKTVEVPAVVPDDPEEAAEIAAAIRELEERRDQLPSSIGTRPTTVTEYVCPPSLLGLDTEASR